MRFSTFVATCVGLTSTACNSGTAETKGGYDTQSPHQVQVRPGDVTTNFGDILEITVFSPAGDLASPAMAAELEELAASAKLYEWPKMREVSTAVELVPDEFDPMVKAHLRFQPDSLTDGWYALGVSNLPSVFSWAWEDGENTEFSAGIRGSRFRVGSEPVVRTVMVCADEDEDGAAFARLNITYSEKVASLEVPESFISIVVDGVAISCEGDIPDGEDISNIRMACPSIAAGKQLTIHIGDKLQSSNGFPIPAADLTVDLADAEQLDDCELVWVKAKSW